MTTGTLTVWKFDTAEGAEETIHALEELAREGLIDLHDALDALGGLPSDPIFTDLTDGQEAVLRDVFGAGGSPVAGEPAGAEAA